MKFAATILTVFYLSFSSAQELIDLVYSFGTNASQGKSVSMSSTKSVYTAGEFKGDLYLGFNSVSANAFQAVFFSKRSNTGTIEWLKAIKGTKDVFASKILTKGNLLLIGGVYSDTVFVGTDTLVNSNQKGFYIAAFDTLGNYLYAFNPTCNSAGVYDFAINNQDELLVVGEFFNAFTFANQDYNSPLGSNFFLAKYDLSTREEIWFRNSFGSGTYASKVKFDSESNILLVGSYGEGTIIGNMTLSNDESGHNLFVAKYLQEGSFSWVRSITGLNQNHGFGLEVGDNDDVFVCGEFEMNVNLPDEGTLFSDGLMDALLIKYDANGNYRWAKKIGGMDDDEGLDLVKDINGNPIILINAGRGIEVDGEDLDPTGFNEPLLVKLNKFDGSYIWHARVPSLQNSGLVKAYSVSIQDSVLVVTGANFTGIQYNSELIDSDNLHDFYMAVFADTNYAEYPVDDLSLNKISDDEFLVYPNPFNSTLTFQTKQPVYEVSVYSVAGVCVYTQEISATNYTIHPILQAGTYVLKLKTEKSIITTKITQL